MTILLIRHATAEAHGLPGGEFVHHLNEKGHKQARRVGRFLKKHDLLPDLLLTSPVPRAKETADLLAEEGGPHPTVEPWLSCGMQPETALHELKAYQDFGRVALVGHEPDLSSLVEHLLGANAYSVQVKKASLISLELGRHPQLTFSLPCRFLR